MKHQFARIHRLQSGISIIELLVSVAITMFVVAAAGYVYLGSRNTQSALDAVSDSADVGAFALDMIGREAMNAGYYPSGAMPSTSANVESYPPTVFNATPPTTDWISPHSIYLSPIFGCDGGQFDPNTATCPTTTAGAADSIVINYFTDDPEDFGSEQGNRYDCTGSKIGNDPSNATRKGTDSSKHPLFPIFGSNFFSLTNSTENANGVDITTKSLACGGNGSFWFGKGGTTPKYQPVISGIEDMQFLYGVFSTSARLIDRYYTATEVNALTSLTLDGITYSPWQRVGAVKVCLLTKTIGGNPKIGDKASQLRTYTSCTGASITQSASDSAIYKRYDRIFAIRSKLNQSY